ncbi:peptidase inhibitor family I36 protein [Amycolatopsis sp. NPDC059027]|uniref:peptidase inhibitor family I36 protein n=1 Tax=unclassified Amycolatopsis TaxID=2618356 RepID=UPI0036708522
MTPRQATASAAVLALVGASVLTGTAGAATTAECPIGAFCVWTNANFTGHRFVFRGDDPEWEDGLARNDSSWVNHADSKPGVADHVKVFDGENRTGHVTICLAPGQKVSTDKAANDRGRSHAFTKHC